MTPAFWSYAYSESGTYQSYSGDADAFRAPGLWSTPEAAKLAAEQAHEGTLVWEAEGDSFVGRWGDERSFESVVVYKLELKD